MSKSIFTSKTFWVNAVAVVASVASVAFGFEITQDMQGEVVALIMGVANIALRFVTTKPVNI